MANEPGIHRAERNHLTVMETDSTKRFSSRVENYVKYRPGYPPAMMDFLKRKLGLLPSHVIADVGSGTGILTELFLKNGNVVFAVEPNESMRKAGEEFLSAYANFQSRAGTAEATGLEGECADYIVAGQAFHWFDLSKTKPEFERILKPNGYVLIVWNDRKTDTPFLAAYEKLLLRHGTDYQKVDHRNITESVLGEFFAPHPFAIEVFENSQQLDWDGIRGRLLSSSYVPPEGHPDFEQMMREFRNLFLEFESDGSVAIEYATRLYYGHLK